VKQQDRDSRSNQYIQFCGSKEKNKSIKERKTFQKDHVIEIRSEYATICRSKVNVIRLIDDLDNIRERV
jgi:hypothetical protein